MDPPALQDRHPFLDPQHRLGRVGLSQQEAGPPRVARVGCKQFGEGRSGWRRKMYPPRDFAGKWQRVALTEGFSGSKVAKNPTMLRMVILPGKCRGG